MTTVNCIIDDAEVKYVHLRSERDHFGHCCPTNLGGVVCWNEKMEVEFRVDASLGSIGSSKVGQWVAGASFHFSDIVNKNGKLSTGDALNWDKGWLEHHQALVWVGRPTVWSHMRSLSTSSKVGRGANDAHAINEFELAMC